MIKRLSKVLFILLLSLTILLTGCKKEPSLKDVNPKNDVYYQVFVRSFADSNGDGVGDIKGIISKLDYLSDLGVSGLWLMPIHPTKSYHGYDVIDYYEVNKEYGTLDDFKELCVKAKEKGIKIIIDLVINHTSREHEWFKKALQGDSKYRNYYVFNEKGATSITGSWGQQIWWGTSPNKYCGYFSNEMPDLNFLNKEVKEEIYNIGKFWLEAGCSGFRLDAAQHFYGENEYLGVSVTYRQNIQFLKDFTNKMKEVNENVYITGEINDNSDAIVKEYFAGIDSPLDFPISKQLIDGANSAGKKTFVSSLIKTYDKYRAIDPDFISAAFLRNHDQNRVANELGGNIEKMKLAAQLLLTLPGSPIIYYGEELGMYGSDGGSNLGAYDITRRLPLPFGDKYQTKWAKSYEDATLDASNNKKIGTVYTQEKDQSSILNLYKAIIKARNENIALKYGNTISVYEGCTNQLQGFYREYSYGNQTQKVLVLFNLGINPIDLPQIPGNVIYSQYDITDKLEAKAMIIYDVTGK